MHEWEGVVGGTHSLLHGSYITFDVPHVFVMSSRVEGNPFTGKGFPNSRRIELAVC
jgi:hypothetical protein